MTPQELPIALDRTALRALFDKAIDEISALRKTNMYSNDFYRRTGDAVFDVGCLALSDARTDTRRMHIISAPAGGGKTTFAYALVAAVERYGENRSDTPFGVVFVVDQMDRADTVFRELNALLPGKVAIWTTEHDPNCKEREKVKAPAAQFTKDQLRDYPVIVVTHKLYLGPNGHKARTVLRNGVTGKRALTIVDEKPDEVPTLEILLSEAQAVREKLVELQPDTKPYIDALRSFMEECSYQPANKLIRAGIELDPDGVAKELGWFGTKEAGHVTKKLANDVPNIERVFAFAKALSVGRAWVITNEENPFFIAYEERRFIDRTAGVILLDATADIDGVSNIVPWRVQTEAPKARYDNLEIIHVPQHTKQRLNKYLKTAENQRAYVTWMVETIKAHMRPGERGLVICKKALFEAERVPTWPDGDPRFMEKTVYAERYGWTIEGRELCATHWGTGVGSNTWEQADVVFLFDEYFIPRRTAVATTQGYRSHRVDEGDLGSMRTLHSKALGVDSIAEGNALRWTKQLALRGHARVYDENGVCGRQRLVVGSDLRRFMMNTPKLFPGAKIRTIDAVSEGATRITKVLDALNKTPDQVRVVSTKALSRLLGKPWRSVSRNVLTEEFMSSIASLGWRYVSLKGKLGARFERIALDQNQGALRLADQAAILAQASPNVQLGPQGA